MQQLVVGNIVEGKVTGITKFGAFVDLGDGKTGMVHISEVAPTFVKEIRDFVKENDTVKVKVLSISEAWQDQSFDEEGRTAAGSAGENRASRTTEAYCSAPGYGLAWSQADTGASEL